VVRERAEQTPVDLRERGRGDGGRGNQRRHRRQNEVSS